MANKRICILDAGPLIHLDELDSLELLQSLGEIFIPESVAYEAEKHRNGITEKIRPHIVGEAETLSWKLAEVIEKYGLGAGETAALAWAEKFGADLFVSDDQSARVAANGLGYKSTGTLGVIVEAADVGAVSVSDAISLLESVRIRTTLHASIALLKKVIASLR